MLKDFLIWIGVFLVFAMGFGLGWYDPFKKEFKADPRHIDHSRGGSTKKILVPLRPGAFPVVEEGESIDKQEPSKVKLPQTAKEVIDRILSEIENGDPKDLNLRKISGYLQLLRDFGEDGSRAIQDFFRTRHDVLLEEDSILIPRLGSYPSVRTALLGILYDMKDPTATAASLEILKNTSVPFEMLLAARNLEKFSPGAYRGETLKALSEIFPKLADPQNQTNPSNFWIFELIGYYKATDMIPQAEELVRKNPGQWTHFWMQALLQMPEEDRLASLQRLIANEGTRKVLTNDVYALSQMDFQSQKSRQWVGEVYRDLTPMQKENFVSYLSHMGGYFNQYMQFDRNPPTLFSKSRIENSLRLLSELAASAGDNPNVKNRIETARKELLNNLKFLSEGELKLNQSFNGI